MTEKVFDTIVIGAGAAGLMTAIQAKRLGLDVLLVDSQKKVGAKILMSGGTRCNVTNKSVSEKDFASNEIRLVRNILRSFTSEKALQFFKDLGIEFVLENDGKYFPSTHSGKTILNALLKELSKRAITLRSETKVKSITCEESLFQVQAVDYSVKSKAVVLCTGGLSYPTTGSDGKGYAFAKTFGHTLIPTIPALTPLRLEDKELQSLSGIAVPCTLSLHTKVKKTVMFTDALLFTHFGLSGPCALNMSRFWLRAKTENAELRGNFLPKLNKDEFLSIIQETSVKHPAKSIKKILCDFFPERLANSLLKKSRLGEKQNLSDFSKKQRQALCEIIFNYSFKVSDVYGYQKAEVTAGGVPLTEVDYKTMQSTKQPGLFFAGEILDADGKIGGFNFQWAWTTGNLAAQGLKKFIS